MEESVDGTRVETHDALDLWRVGIAVFFAALLSNIIAHYLLSFVLTYPPNFIPLKVTSIAILTAMGAIGGTLVFVFLHQRFEQPELTFRRIGWIVLGLSIVPIVIGYLQPKLFPIPGANSYGFLMLLPFHLIAGIVIIGLLSRLHES
jgi:hypothetical protein